MQLDLLLLWVLLVTYLFHKYWQLGVQGKKSKMFCSVMENSCYNEFIVLYLCLCIKYLSHVDEFQYQENVEQHYRMYQRWSSSSCQSFLKHPEQVLSVPVLLQLMCRWHNAHKIIKYCINKLLYDGFLHFSHRNVCKK